MHLYVNCRALLGHNLLCGKTNLYPPNLQSHPSYCIGIVHSNNYWLNNKILSSTDSVNSSLNNTSGQLKWLTHRLQQGNFETYAIMQHGLSKVWMLAHISRTITETQYSQLYHSSPSTPISLHNCDILQQIETKLRIKLNKLCLASSANTWKNTCS